MEQLGFLLAHVAVDGEFLSAEESVQLEKEVPTFNEWNEKMGIVTLCQ